MARYLSIAKINELNINKNYYEKSNNNKKLYNNYTNKRS